MNKINNIDNIDNIDDISNSIFKTPLRNLTTEKLLDLKKYMNIDDYLEQNFSYVKQNKYELYVVSTNDTPKFSYFDSDSYDIFNAINIWVDKLIIKPNINNELFNNLLNNYIIAYGEYNFLNEKKKELLLVFNKYLIPIYNTDYLHFNYKNSYILYPNFYYTNWRPIDNDQYNQIIETIMFLIFDILVILKPNSWSYLNNDFLYNYIYRDINSNSYIVNNDRLSRKEIIKTYLYQTWLFLMNNKNFKDFFYSQDTNTIIYPFEEISNNKYWTNNRHNIVLFLIEYINKNYIINSEKFEEINIKNDTESIFLFNYNVGNFNYDNDTNKTTIILFFIAFIIICIGIITYLFIKNKFKLVTDDKNPFRFIIGD